MEIPWWIWALNIIGGISAVWFLSWKIRSKITEVEQRHVMSGIAHRKRLDEAE